RESHQEHQAETRSPAQKAEFFLDERTQRIAKQSARTAVEPVENLGDARFPGGSRTRRGGIEVQRSRELPTRKRPRRCDPQQQNRCRAKRRRSRHELTSGGPRPSSPRSCSAQDSQSRAGRTIGAYPNE